MGLGRTVLPGSDEKTREQILDAIGEEDSARRKLFELLFQPEDIAADVGAEAAMTLPGTPSSPLMLLLGRAGRRLVDSKAVDSVIDLVKRFKPFAGSTSEEFASATKMVPAPERVVSGGPDPMGLSGRGGSASTEVNTHVGGLFRKFTEDFRMSDLNEMVRETVRVIGAPPEKENAFQQLLLHEFGHLLTPRLDEAAKAVIRKEVLGKNTEGGIKRAERILQLRDALNLAGSEGYGTRLQRELQETLQSTERSIKNRGTAAAVIPPDRLLRHIKSRTNRALDTGIKEVLAEAFSSRGPAIFDTLARGGLLSRGGRDQLVDEVGPVVDRFVRDLDFAPGRRAFDMRSQLHDPPVDTESFVGKADELRELLKDLLSQE